MEKEQLNKWKSNFGVEYTDRNKISPKCRVNAFKSMLTGLDVDKILEIGCNVGHNLVAISEIGEFQLIGL